MLDTIAQRYGKRPSEIIHIENEFEAFDFDVAVLVFSEQKREELQENKNVTIESNMTELEKLQMQFAKIKAMQQAESPYG